MTPWTLFHFFLREQGDLKSGHGSQNCLQMTRRFSLLATVFTLSLKSDNVLRDDPRLSFVGMLFPSTGDDDEDKVLISVHHYSFNKDDCCLCFHQSTLSVYFSLCFICARMVIRQSNVLPRRTRHQRIVEYSRAGHRATGIRSRKFLGFSSYPSLGSLRGLLHPYLTHKQCLLGSF